MGITRECAVTYGNVCNGVTINYEIVGITDMNDIKSKVLKKK